MTKSIDHKVLIVTGGLLHAGEKSVWTALRKQYMQFKSSKSHWLETKIKLVAAELLVYAKMSMKPSEVIKYLDQEHEPIPELTEVVIADLLEREGIPFEAITYDQIFSDPSFVERMLNDTNVVFASTTLLHDMSEMMPLMKMLKRSHNRIVVGGALCGSLYKTWPGDPLVEIMAIGYGEYLMQSLAEWIKSGFQNLTPPPTGRIVDKGNTVFLFSGVPSSKDLDTLPTPDWSVAERYHGQNFKHIYYESVRGCPYRCSFCNYPFLFDDKKFRYKSAEKMAADWQHYEKELGVQYITCLDSLFTMPKKRLIRFCELLVQQKSKIKWVCYARADDLTDHSVVQLMKAAGANQVQIGLESGNQQMLDNMNKRCTVESNLEAIHNCRKYGISSLISLIVGYPGETAETLNDTLIFMRKARPDFHFLATFSVRIEEVPMFNVVNRTRFGLQRMENAYSFAPYWRHNTMCCSEAGNHVRAMGMALCKEKVSLDGALFYNNIINYKPEMREQFLDYQAKLVTGFKFSRPVFNLLNKYVDRKLKSDTNKIFDGQFVPGAILPA
jgi:anaerobic magnesium-protoporphyrin IX monomethyl ester cyclase